MSAKVVINLPTDLYDEVFARTRGNNSSTISKFMQDAAREKLERDTMPSIVPEPEEVR